MLRRGHRLPRRSESEIEQLRAAGRLAAQTLEYIEPHVQPGVSTYELDRLCFEYITNHGAYPSPLNYPGPPLDLSKPLRFSKGGFPGSICTSLNEVVCHGIPSRDQVLKEGDIINVDVTVTLDGWFGDTSKTFVMPGASDAVRALVQRTQECLYLGIRAISDPSAYRRLNQSAQRFTTTQTALATAWCGTLLGMASATFFTASPTWSITGPPAVVPRSSQGTFSRSNP